MSTFFLAMTLHPEVLCKARDEIDRVVGTHRLPTFSDRESLPYVEAVVKESFRWHPIGPMGLPHVASQDDICGEYLIPKGAMLLPNIW
jgi:cytochrome P450